LLSLIGIRKSSQDEAQPMSARTMSGPV